MSETKVGTASNDTKRVLSLVTVPVTVAVWAPRSEAAEVAMSLLAAAIDDSEDASVVDAVLAIGEEADKNNLCGGGSPTVADFTEAQLKDAGEKIPVFDEAFVPEDEDEAPTIETLMSLK